MTSSIKQLVAACLLGALALPASAAAQGTQNQGTQNQGTQNQGGGETVKATHGAWEIVCATNQPELCVMRQVGELDDGTQVLEVRVRKLDGVTTENGESVPAAIRILTPLGSLIQSGLTVQIDSSEPRTGLFEVCLRQGCIVEDPMSQDFLGRLKAGAVARMSFNMLQQGEIGVNVSLNGFTAAFNSL